MFLYIHIDLGFVRSSQSRVFRQGRIFHSAKVDSAGAVWSRSFNQQSHHANYITSESREYASCNSTK